MPDQLITRGVSAVQPQMSQAGRNYWIVTDDQNQEWRCFESNVAMQAQQLIGQMAVMKVSISPARDPQFGMNYYLRAISAAPAGSQPTGPMPLMQPTLPLPGGQTAMPGPEGFAQAQPPMAMPQLPMVPMVPPMASMPASMPEVLRPATKTLGQGGNLSDADITRMCRSSAIAAIVGVAFTSDDFRGPEMELDWEKIYLASEAVSKFILERRHEGWIPGKEIQPTNEKVVLAEVQAQFPGAQEVSGTEAHSPGADSVETPDDDIPWE